MKRCHVCNTRIEGPTCQRNEGYPRPCTDLQAEGPTGQPPREGGEPGATCQVRPNRSVRPNLAWPPLFPSRLLRRQTDPERRSGPWSIEVGGSWGSAEPPGSAEPTPAPVGLLLCQGTPLQLLPINMRWGATESAPTFGQEQETHSLSLSLGSSGVRVRVS